MTALEDVRAYRRVNEKVSTGAVRQVRRLVAATASLALLDRRDTLLVNVPKIVDSAASTMGDFAASWASELFAAKGIKFTPAGTPLPNPNALEASIRWAVGPMFGDAPGTVAGNLSGMVERMIADAGRQAVADDWGGMRTDWHRRSGSRRAAYQRFPTPGCCDWCAMLASRGAVYWTEAAGEAGGHDRCYCVIAPVFTSDDWANDIASRYDARYRGEVSREDDAAIPEDAISQAVRDTRS